MKKAAIVSYNTFLPDVEENGWKEGEGCRVLLIQNEDGLDWGVNNLRDDWGSSECKDAVEGLWPSLASELETIDLFVLYVGSFGAEHIIELAAEHGLTPDRTVFVLCDCNYNTKRQTLQSCGFADARQLMCHCGGHREMADLFYHLMEHGTLPA